MLYELILFFFRRDISSGVLVLLARGIKYRWKRFEFNSDGFFFFLPRELTYTPSYNNALLFNENPHGGGSDNGSGALTISTSDNGRRNYTYAPLCYILIAVGPRKRRAYYYFKIFRFPQNILFFFFFHSLLLESQPVVFRCVLPTFFNRR